MEANCQVHVPAAFTPLGKRLPVPTGCAGLRAAQAFLRTGKFLLFRLAAISVLLMGVEFISPGRPARGPVTALTELSLFPTVLQMGHICSYPCSPLYCRWVTYVFPVLPFVKNGAVWLQLLPGGVDSVVQSFGSARRETGASVVNFRVL